MTERLTSPRIPAPRFHYTPCLRHGALGFVSGMVALDPQGGGLVESGVARQTQRIFENLLLALPDYGYTLADLAQARIYTTRFDEFAQINEVWERVFADIPPPARTSVGVSALPLGALVEIDFIFCAAGATA